MRFFVIRHGETAWNVEGRFQGQKDTALNEKGLAQAATRGERLAGHSFEAVLTSPLDRAKKTAELAAAKCEFGEFTEIPAFTEINHGDWEGRLSTEVAEEWPELLRRCGETAALALSRCKEREARFISIEELGRACPKVSQSHLEQLKALLA